jgi:AraC-like DNA-binding protein
VALFYAPGWFFSKCHSPFTVNRYIITRVIFKFHIPVAPLDVFIDSMVYMKAGAVAHSIERLLPDGNVVLIIDLTTEPKYIYDDETLLPIQTCKKAWFSGIHTRGLLIPAGQDAHQLVITFKKGKSFPFLQMPLTEVAGIVVDTDLVMQGINRLREALLHCAAAEGGEDVFSCAEAFFLGEYLGKLSENACVDYAVSRIVAAPERLTMEEIAGNVGYSQKHFIHLFKQHVGVAPKSYLRIIRFNKTLSEIAAAPSDKRTIDWTALALDCGYYDQAHFIGDFKKFSGYTPEEYLAKRSPLPNYVPVV